MDRDPLLSLGDWLVGGLPRWLADAYWESRRRRAPARVMRAWTRTALDCGFDLPIRVGDDVSMKAPSDGFAIELRELASAPGTCISLTRGDVVKTVHLRLETRDDVARFSTLSTGDETFDRSVHADGDEALAAAVLDQVARPAVLLAVLRGVTLEEGVLFRRHAQTLDEAPAVNECVRRMKMLAGYLVVPDDVAGRLADNARNDPEPGARAHVLAVLARRFPDRALLVLREALADSDEEVRLVAALGLGAEATSDLVRLASNEDLREATRVRAFGALGERLPAAIVASLLGPSLERDPVPVMRAAVGALETATQKAQPTFEAAHEQLLVTALRHRSEAVRVAAAGALGHLGSPAAVSHLDLAIGDHALDFEFDRVARRAIAEIQERAPGASPGQLSLASEGGGLSLSSSAETGAVTLASGERERGQGKGDG